MNDFDELLKEVENKLNEEECVKEYFRLKKIIENDEELVLLDKEVRFHQKEMCRYENNDGIYFKEKKLYEDSLAKLEANPIYLNFIEIKKEVNALLKEVAEVLN